MTMDGRMAGAVDAEDRSREHRRLKRRWTLGGLMILIAVLALPLAVIVHQQREIERMRREAEMARDLAKATSLRVLKEADELERAVSEQRADPLPLAPPEAKEMPR
jgi:hypothetical protein